MNPNQMAEIKILLHILEMAMGDAIEKWCLYGGTYEVAEEMSKIKIQIEELSENLY